MTKPTRKAVRCYLIDNNKVITIKYKKGNKKEDYYDIPGGKIENGELPEQTAIREMKEETGIEIKNPKYKGNIIVEYPDRIYDFDIFITNNYKGEPQEFEENTSEWIDIKTLLQKEKILSNLMILNKFFIKGLINDEYNFKLKIEEDEEENISNINYNIIKL